MIVKIDNSDEEVLVSDFTLATDSIEVGDLYVGKRNNGWKFGTYKYTSDEGYIFDSGKPPIYPFNDYECRKVISKT